MGWFFDFWHWWTTARVASAAAAAGGVMAVVTGSTAVRSLRHNRKATHRATRPMMVATLKPTSAMSAGLEIANVGQSIARVVEVTFDPPLPTHEQTPDGENSIIPLVRRRFSTPIDAWAPGYIARSEFLVLGNEQDEQGRHMNIDGIPRETAVLFTYVDDDGNAYTDRMSLDPTLIEGETWSVQNRSKGGDHTTLHDGAPWLG
ncbi:hypothetical protein F3087_34145 [Nocardia colli]|uniref:Uncharacterized protein n=1 Tax=Nocardia colli TaxID=2545717 RepID=A0A5N0E4A5_9NOCA|nr:hypothetical protein [Nocardia colli]KAA8884267.1 hypothetical protein F3087_34145 [Nocardia colli]